MIACNVWLLDGPEVVLNYALHGGRILMITEDEDPRLQYIPNKITATILLPPYDVLSDELDGKLEMARAKYFEYLSNREPAEFIAVLLAAAVQNVQIGIYFGDQLKDLKFPWMFMEYMSGLKGMTIGYRNIYPGIDEHAMPLILLELYNRGYITAEQYLMLMPVDIDIPAFMIFELTRIFRPAFVDNNDYNAYFKDLIKRMKQAGKYLYSPIVAPEVVV